MRAFVRGLPATHLVIAGHGRGRDQSTNMVPILGASLPVELAENWSVGRCIWIERLGATEQLADVVTGEGARAGPVCSSGASLIRSRSSQVVRGPRFRGRAVEMGAILRNLGMTVVAEPGILVGWVVTYMRPRILLVCCPIMPVRPLVGPERRASFALAVRAIARPSYC